MASITFTDDVGTVTIVSDIPAPGNRCQGWKPLVNPIGPMHNALGTGIPYKYRHRSDYGAKFELRELPHSMQDDGQRLLDWLLNGGIVTLTTGDANLAEYDCYLWPGAEPDMSPPDPKSLRFVLSLSLLNSEAGVRMTCVYF